MKELLYWLGIGVCIFLILTGFGACNYLTDKGDALVKSVEHPK